MRITDFIVQVAAVSGQEEFVGTVDSAGDYDSDFDGTVLSDDALDVAVQPRGIVEQVVDMEFWADDELVQRGDMMDQMTVDRDYDNVVQGWGVTNPLWSPSGVFGTPWACYGPGIGKKRITIKGLYATPTGVHRINLLTDGVCDNAERQSGEGGIFEVLEGGDGVARYDGVKVTKIFPPGHGLYRGRLFREIVRELGDTQMNFEDGNRMDIEVQLVDALPIPTMAEIAEVENRRILKDSDGYWVNPRVGRVRTGESPVFSFEERDILRVATVTQKMPNNPITLVIAKGERQKTKEDCGDVWQVETQYFYETPYTYKTSLYQQNADGTYTSATPEDPTTTPVLVQKIETSKLFRCDVLVEQIVKTWKLTRREVPRHEWEGGDGTDPELQDGWRCLPCYTDDNDGVGGGPAYGDLREQFYLVSISRTFCLFIKTGYGDISANFGGFAGYSEHHFNWYHAITFPPYSWLKDYPPESNEARAHGQYGQAIGSVTFFSMFGHVEGSIKTRGTFSGFPVVPWNEVEPDLGRKLWGSGGGVNSPAASYSGFISTEGVGNPSDYDVLIPWSITANILFGDDKNFLTKEGLYQWGWRAPRGSQFYYGENDSRSEEQQSFRLLDEDVTTYAATGSSHTKTASFYDTVKGENRTEVTTGISGHLPPIDRLDSVTPNPDIYEDGEQEDLAKPAARTDTETVVVTVPFDFLLTCHLPREVTVDYPWAENEAELQAMAEALASESAAQAVFFTLPANFLIREAMPIHLIYAPLDINHSLRVKAVKWARSPEQPILTQVEARLYTF